jgi:hypothetical protein
MERKAIFQLGQVSENEGVFCSLIQVHGSSEIYRGYQLKDGCLLKAFTTYGAPRPAAYEELKDPYIVPIPVLTGY